ncbi:MAG: hypothetical protein ACLTK8_08180, partial [Paeniclostridium sp.]
NKANIWDAIMNIGTHYNRMRLLAEMKSNKMQIIKQHEEMLDIIKNKEFDKIDTYINKHRVEPASNWETLINENEELKVFFK